ncbi:uncharacterized protein LOC107268942 [Cephus cinctus]|uniref:Uncharacterized protein LOC107268942 n=1 Tax=Cephus cinctus TaxID=211228 RepID=A0AAJ7FLI6_CEPCN|nr:uncharacterized protein LOC107268942 [Cephus cinctus]
MRIRQFHPCNFKIVIAINKKEVCYRYPTYYETRFIFNSIFKFVYKYFAPLGATLFFKICMVLTSILLVRYGCTSCFYLNLHSTNMEDLHYNYSGDNSTQINKFSSLCTLCKCSLDSIGSARTLQFTYEEELSSNDMDKSYQIENVTPLVQLKSEEDKSSLALSFNSSLDIKTIEDSFPEKDHRMVSVHKSSQDMEIRVDDVQGESKKGLLNVAQNFLESNFLDRNSKENDKEWCSIQNPQIVQNVVTGIFDENKNARMKEEDHLKMGEESNAPEMGTAGFRNNEFEHAFESQFPREEELDRIECEALNIKKPAWLENPAVPPDCKTLRRRILQRREVIFAMAQELLNLSCHVENIRQTMLSNDLNVASTASAPCHSRATITRKRPKEIPFYNSNMQNSVFIHKKIKPDKEDFFKP